MHATLHAAAHFSRGRWKSISPEYLSDQIRASRNKEEAFDTHRKVGWTFPRNISDRPGIAPPVASTPLTMLPTPAFLLLLMLRHNIWKANAMSAKARIAGRFPLIVLTLVAFLCQYHQFQIALPFIDLLLLLLGLWLLLVLAVLVVFSVVVILRVCVCVSAVVIVSVMASCFLSHHTGMRAKHFLFLNHAIFFPSMFVSVPWTHAMLPSFVFTLHVLD